MPPEEDRKNKIKTVGVMMAITLLGKVLGLVRDMLLGHNFATGMEANAFLAASRIPRNFFDAIFASAISVSFIPVFNEYLEKNGKEEAFRLSHAFLTVIALATALLSFCGSLLAQPLTAFLADGFDPETAALCTELLRILFPIMFFTGIAFSIVGILQSLGEFNIPALLSTASNTVIILYYLFFCERFGIIGLAVAFLAGWGVQVLIQLPSLHRLGYRYRFSLWHEGLKKVLKLVLPVLVSTWVQPINLMVAAKYASRLNGGAAASALEYANTLYSIVAGVFVLSLANVIFPEMSRLAARADGESLGRQIGKTQQVMLFILTPMAVGLAVLSVPVVRLLYEHGAWTRESTALTAGALRYFSVGMLGYGLQIILSRAYYAQQKGKMPLISGAASVLSNLILCHVLSPQLGLEGLAIASAASLILPALILLFALAARYPDLLSRDAGLDFIKTLLCAALMGAAVYGVTVFLSGALPEILGDGILSRVLQAGVPALVGAAVYFVLAALLRLDTLKEALNLIRRK